MKRLFLVVLALVVTLMWLSPACGTPEEETVESYQDVSLEGLKVTISANWVKDKLSAEMVQAITESEGAFNVVKYRDKDATVDLALTVIDMKAWCELTGDSWQGWEQFPELTGVTNQEYVEWLAYSGLQQSQNIVMEESRMLAINNKEACEILYSAEIEGIPVYENYLFLFGENKLGTTFVIIKDVDWSEYRGCWPRIRESARLES